MFDYQALFGGYFTNFTWPGIICFSVAIWGLYPIFKAISKIGIGDYLILFVPYGCFMGLISTFLLCIFSPSADANNPLNIVGLLSGYTFLYLFSICLGLLRYYSKINGHTEN